MVLYCENTIESILEEFLSDNTGPPGDEYRCYASFRFFKVPQKVIIRKSWMVLLVSKCAGSAFADCFKTTKVASINIFKTFRDLFNSLQKIAGTLHCKSSPKCLINSSAEVSRLKCSDKQTDGSRLNFS